MSFADPLRIWLIAAAALWAPVSASANPCDDSRAEESQKRQEWLMAKLDLMSSQFQISQIDVWRLEYNDPVLLEAELRAALQSEANERPVVELAKVAYQQAEFDVRENCPDADG